MKVLFTSPVLENPAAGGPQLRIENTVKALSKVTELYIIYQANHLNEAVRRTNEFFAPYARKYVAVYQYPKNKFIRFVLRALRRLVSLKLDKQAETIIDFVKSNEIEVIWFGYGNISFPLIMRVKSELPYVKIVCDTDSVWSRFILRELPFADERRRDRIKKLGEAKKAEEREWVRICDVTTAVSKVDADYYKSIAEQPSRVHLFSNVVDLEQYRQQLKPPENLNKPCVFLAGSFGPNSAMNMAATWMLDEILPIVREAFPDVHFYIVGRRSDSEFGHRASSQVTVTGMLDSVLPYLQHADVAVVPLMFESGTRFKILEAGACGTALVSTTLGAEGIPVIHNKDCLIADTTMEFAAAIVRILSSDKLGDQLVSNCYRLIAERYSIEALEYEAKQICEYLKNV